MQKYNLSPIGALGCHYGVEGEFRRTPSTASVTEKLDFNMV